MKLVKKTNNSEKKADSLLFLPVCFTEKVKFSLLEYYDHFIN
jgi:hypothetical protein